MRKNHKNNQKGGGAADLKSRSVRPTTQNQPTKNVWGRAFSNFSSSDSHFHDFSCFLGFFKSRPSFGSVAQMCKKCAFEDPHGFSHIFKSEFYYVFDILENSNLFLR
jgi:hypothetical protein